MDKSQAARSEYAFGIRLSKLAICIGNALLIVDRAPATVIGPIC